MEIKLDRFVSKKHALLLKYAGYNEPCFAYYDDNDLFLFTELSSEKNDNTTIHIPAKSWWWSRNKNYFDRVMLAPTVADMKMWLEHKGYVFNYDSKVIGKFVANDKTDVSFREDEEVNYKIFKTILEQAIEHYCRSVEITKNA